MFQDLQIAMMNDNTETVKKCLYQDKNTVNIQNRQGRTLLMEATILGKVEIVNLLLGAGADVNIQDKNGWSAVHFAAQTWSPKITELLLKNNADFNVQDNFGNTPLHRAVFESQGRGEIILLLLTAGANPNKTNKHGVTPISLASSITNYDVKRYFKDR